MSTTQVPAEHAVVKRIFLALKAINPSLDSESLSFESCLAIAVSKNARCGRVLGSRQQANAVGFVNYIRGLDRSPITDDFSAQIESFLRDVICWQHVDDAWGTFSAVWKTDVLPPSASPIHEATDGAGSEAIYAMESASRVTVEGQEVIDSKGVEVVAIEPIVDQFSALSVSKTAQNGTNCSLDESSNEVKISGRGVTFLSRKHSVRDGSQIIQEMYKPLLQMQQEKGILYVLKDTGSDDLFKIGYTQKSAPLRLNQLGKCVRANRNVVILYESPGGPFFAAHKAEKLAQTVLSNHRLRIEECKTCLGGHKDWFQASERVVLDAVRAMEQFVRLPAYEKVASGEWKLTDSVSQAVKELTRLDFQKLVGSLRDPSPDPAAEEDGSLQSQVGSEILKAGSGGTAPLVQVVSISEDSATSEISRDTEDCTQPDSASLASDTMNGELQRHTRRSLGRLVAKSGKTVVRKFSAGVETIRGMRSGTPETDGSQANPGNNSSSNRIGAVMADIVFSILPQDEKERKESYGLPVLQRGRAFLSKVHKGVLAQFEDFQEEWDCKDDSEKLS